MKTLYSLGDSYMTTDDPHDGIVSFCELYCQRKEFNHVSLARPGATNFAIRLQIEKAIEQHADYVVIGTTCSDRFDIALDISSSCVKYVIDNIFYTAYQAKSKKHVDQHNVTLVSDTFTALVNRHDQTYLCSEQQSKSLKSYLTYLHNPSLATQKDYYTISDGLRKLQSHHIEFILLPGYMSQHDWSWVSKLWPTDLVMPYQMPYGEEGWYDPPKNTTTHNPHWAHEEFCKSLLGLTQDWHN